MDARREIQRLRLAVERVEVGPQDRTRPRGRERLAVQLEGIGLRRVAEDPLALRRLFETVHRTPRSRHRIGERAVAQGEADAPERRRDGQRANLVRIEVDPPHVPLREGKREGRRLQAPDALRPDRRHRLARLQHEDAARREAKFRPRPLPFRHQHAVGRLLQVERHRRAVVVVPHDHVARDGARPLEDAQTGARAGVNPVHRRVRRREDRSAAFLAEIPPGADREHERLVRRFVLLVELERHLARVERAQQCEERGRAPARVRRARGGLLRVADGGNARKRRLAREAGRARRLGEERAHLAGPALPFLDRRQVAVLLHKPPHVHHLHARHVVVDVVEGHQPEHLAHARGRHVARPEGEEFDESPAPSAPRRMLREGERQPLGTAGARARADLVHARQGLALEDVEGVAVAAAAARHAVLTDQVPREDDAHAVAPRPDLVEVGRAELAAHQLGVDLPHGGGRRGGRALRVRRARREPRLDVRAEGAPRRRPVVRLQAAPPTEAGDRTPLEGHPRRMTGLVREDAPDRPVLEPPREALLVDLVRQLDEARDRLGFVDVHPALRRKELRPAVRAVRLAVDGVLGVAPGVVLAGDAAPARPARPVVLVVEPYLHAARLGFAAEPFVQPQPLLAHVGVLESAPGVD